MTTETTMESKTMIHLSHKKFTETIELRACGPLLLVVSYDHDRTLRRFDVLSNAAEQRSIVRAAHQTMQHGQRDLFGGAS